MGWFGGKDPEPKVEPKVAPVLNSATVDGIRGGMATPRAPTLDSFLGGFGTLLGAVGGGWSAWAVGMPRIAARIPGPGLQLSLGIPAVAFGSAAAAGVGSVLLPAFVHGMHVTYRVAAGVTRGGLIDVTGKDLSQAQDESSSTSQPKQ